MGRYHKRETIFPQRCLFAIAKPCNQHSSDTWAFLILCAWSSLEPSAWGGNPGSQSFTGSLAKLSGFWSYKEDLIEDPTLPPVPQLCETGDQHLVLFSFYRNILRRIGEGIMLERMWILSVRNHPDMLVKIQLPFIPWAAEAFTVLRNQQVLNLCMQRQMLKSSWTVEQVGSSGGLQSSQVKLRAWAGSYADGWDPTSKCFQMWRFHNASILPIISHAFFFLFVKQHKHFCYRNITQISSSIEISWMVF